MKKIYSLVPILTLCFYFTSAQKPVANFTASADSVCPGSTVNFTDQSTNAPTAWQWNFQGGYPPSSTDQNPQNIIFLDSGSYTVKLVASNSNGSDSVTKTIFVYLNPRIPPFSTSHDTLFINVDSSYASYKWYANDTIIVGATKPFYVLYSDTCGGGFMVGVTDTSTGCGTGFGILILCDGVSNLINENAISVYPVPAEDQLTIHCSDNYHGEVTISVMNVFGELINEEKHKLSDYTSVNISALPAGIYFLQIKSEKGIILKKFIKE